jgi:serine/threonine protein kinase
MSPEQAQALGSEIDHRTDIYSAGIVLYELLTLHRPFEGSNSPAVLYRITHEKPRSIAEFAPKVPTALAAICMKAMSKRPEGRYQSAGELAQDLERFLLGERVRAPRPSVLRQAYEIVVYGHPKAAALGGVGLALLLVLSTPRQQPAMASDHDGTSPQAVVRSGVEGLLPPSRDEAVLRPWRKMMKAIIKDAGDQLPDQPIFHDE